MTVVDLALDQIRRGEIQGYSALAQIVADAEKSLDLALRA